MSFELPVRFGRYLLVERLGRGSTAEVFRARPLEGRRRAEEVALRRLRSELADDEPRRVQFLRDAEQARGLSCPLFCAIHEVGEADGLPFATMDLVVGPSLSRLLRWLRLRGRPAPLGAALQVGARLCAGLHQAWAPPFGLVHGDLSPQNVLVQAGGQLKLVDAGTDPGESDELIGTLGYLSPEQLGGAPPGHLSDLYACAVLIWELLAHARLFPARTPAQALLLRRQGPPPLPAGCAPEPVESLLRRGLDVDPARRFQSGKELRLALLAEARRAGIAVSAAELMALVALAFGQSTPK